MAAEEGGGTGVPMPDPMKAFQQWFNSEIEKRESELIGFLSSLTFRLGDKLNKDLQAELDQYKQQNAELQARLDSRSSEPTGDVSKATKCPEDQEGSVTFETYNTLREQQEITYQSLKVALKALDEYKAKHRRAKDLIRPWKEYAERCEQRLRARRTELATPESDLLRPPLERPSVGPSDLASSRPSSAGADGSVKKTRGSHSRSSSGTAHGVVHSRAPAPKSPSKLRSAVTARLMEDEDEPDLPIAPVEIEDEQDFHQAEAALFAPDLLHRPALPHAHSQLQRTSSGVTEDTGDLPSADEPRARSAPVVSEARDEATLPPPQKNIWQQQPGLPDGSPQAPIHIKSEPDSSPIIMADRSTLTRMTTFDLDDAGYHVDTPRKRQRTQALVRSNSSFSRSFPPPGADMTSMLDDAPQPLQPISPNRRKVQMKTFGKPANTAKIRKHHLAEEVESVTEDGHILRSNLKTNSPSKKMRADTTLQALLTEQTPVQKQMITPKTDPGARRNAPRPFAPVENEMEENDRMPITPVTAVKKAPQAKSAQGRLIVPESLLPRQSDHESSVTWTEEKIARMRTVYPGWEPQTTSTTPKPKTSDKPTAVFKAPARTSPRKRAVPLRQRPVSDLTPQDFKLNPLAHGSLDLTTLDPARTKADRSHFHNCTSPSCATCGPTLRELARTLPLTVGSSLWASTQEDLDSKGREISEDEKIIRHFLGPAQFNTSNLRRMPRPEYDELLLDAKTALVAERYGRHKLRPGGRARSPPGYWDVDMPTTQQIEAQRVEREQRDRDVVAERYREAMKGGRDGRWMFKDE